MENIGITEIAVAAGVVYLIVSGIFKSVIHRAKRIEAAGVKLDLSGMDEQTANVIKTIWKRFDEMQATLSESKTQYKELAKSNEAKLDILRKENEIIIGKQDGFSTDLMKLMFYSRDLNDEERLIAGLKYVAGGHNHQLKRDVIEFAVANESIYRTAARLAPKYKIPAVEEKIESSQRAALNNQEA